MSFKNIKVGTNLFCKESTIKDLQKAIELYHQDNKTDKVNELEIAIANLNLDL